MQSLTKIPKRLYCSNDNIARRAFIDPKYISNACVGYDVALSDAGSKHFLQVLRLKENHTVELFDGLGKGVIGKLKKVNERSCFVTVTEIKYVQSLMFIISNNKLLQLI